MRQNAWNIGLFVVLVTGLGIGWYYAEKKFFPPADPPPAAPPPAVKPSMDQAAAVGGYASLAGGPHSTLKVTPAKPTDSPTAGVVEKPTPTAPIAPREPHKLITLGGEGYRQTILLNSQGAGVQQVILNHFEEADRVGKIEKDESGRPRKLHLVPGFFKPRSEKVTVAPPHVDIAAGPVSPSDARNVLTEPSYTLFHYPTKGDPDYREADIDPDAGRFPSPELGTRTWKVASEGKVGDVQTVRFETELGSPYHLRIAKTFSLSPGDYHVGMTIDIEPLPGRQKGAPFFRYQIAGARGLPIEGEWYTQTFRNAYVGRQDPAKPTKFYRDIEDSGSINLHHGGDLIPKAATRIVYASVGTQYFASGLAIDVRDPAAGSPLSAVRPTREVRAIQPTTLPQIDDITIRAIAEPLELADGKPVRHPYIVYNGPIKIQLLNQLKGPEAVDPELVRFYSEQLGLTTMTDYHSPFFLGRFANSIGWTDAIIFFTNIMHKVLGWMHAIVPVWGLNIIMLTVLVRLCLMPFSRRQQLIMAKMQAKMAAHQPELDKIKEKYKNDPQAFNQAKTRYMLDNGMLNPKAQMAGCLLLFAQMPVFMGLYFCLQESVFFRLSPFLWIKNLAAPDMLFFWTESIPLLSDPSQRTGFWSFLYLGPYFNLLPVISVTLMFIHTKLTMPPATDEMQEQQQKMMKFMMIFMGLFFYKIAAGLALYFICSTAWGLTERKLIPKPKIKEEVLPPPPSVGANGKVGGPPAPKGFFGRLMDKVEEAQRLSESQRQIRNEPRDGGGNTRKDRKRK